MTQINLPKSQNNPTPPAPASPQLAPQPWGDNWDDTFSQPSARPPQPPSKRLTPQERVEIIEKVYQEVLGRKPDTRDINYYKYSTLGEEEIKTQLITGKEHKQLLEDGHDYKKMKDRASQAETRVKILESQIRDQVDEFTQLTNILNEKNSYIKELREQHNNPYNFESSPPQSHDIEQNVQENIPSSQVFVNSQVLESAPNAPQKTSPSLVDRIKKVILPTS